VFRNLYAKPIDRDRIMLVQKKIPEATQCFGAAVENYAAMLEQMQARLVAAGDNQAPTA
jgi:hypothetical protein